MTAKKDQKTDAHRTHYMIIKGRKKFKFPNLLVALHCSSKGIKRANTVLNPVLQLSTDDLKN